MVKMTPATISPSSLPLKLLDKTDDAAAQNLDRLRAEVKKTEEQLRRNASNSWASCFMILAILVTFTLTFLTMRIFPKRRCLVFCGSKGGGSPRVVLSSTARHDDLHQVGVKDYMPSEGGIPKAVYHPTDETTISTSTTTTPRERSQEEDEGGAYAQTTTSLSTDDNRQDDASSAGKEEDTSSIIDDRDVSRDDDDEGLSQQVIIDVGPDGGEKLVDAA